MVTAAAEREQQSGRNCRADAHSVIVASAVARGHVQDRSLSHAVISGLQAEKRDAAVAASLLNPGPVAMQGSAVLR